MVTIKVTYKVTGWYQDLISDYSQVYWSFDSTKPAYPIKFLLPQGII